MTTNYQNNLELFDNEDIKASIKTFAMTAMDTEYATITKEIMVSSKDQPEVDPVNGSLNSDGRLEKRLKQLFAQNMLTNGIIDDKAIAAIDRIKAKLKGRDFKNFDSLSVEDQVDRLIKQATDPVNLCQAFLGWNPFI